VTKRPVFPHVLFSRPVLAALSVF